MFALFDSNLASSYKNGVWLLQLHRFKVPKTQRIQSQGNCFKIWLNEIASNGIPNPKQQLLSLKASKIMMCAEEKKREELKRQFQNRKFKRSDTEFWHLFTHKRSIWLMSWILPNWTFEICRRQSRVKTLFMFDPV